MKKVLIILILISLGGWVMFLREHRAFVDYKQQQEAASVLKQAAQSQIAAIFERLDGTTMYFKTPIQTTTPAGTFVNYKEQTGTINDSTVVMDATGSSTNATLQTLKPNAQLSLELVPDPSHPGQSLIKIVYITQ